MVVVASRIQECCASSGVEAPAYPTVTNPATVSSSIPTYPAGPATLTRFVVVPDANITLTKSHQGDFTVSEQSC
jgi:hypothetical protein